MDVYKANMTRKRSSLEKKKKKKGKKGKKGGRKGPNASSEVQNILWT